MFEFWVFLLTFLIVGNFRLTKIFLPTSFWFFKDNQNSSRQVSFFFWLSSTTEKLLMINSLIVIFCQEDSSNLESSSTTTKCLRDFSLINANYRKEVYWKSGLFGTNERPWRSLCRWHRRASFSLFLAVKLYYIYQYLNDRLMKSIKILDFVCFNVTQWWVCVVFFSSAFMSGMMEQVWWWIFLHFGWNVFKV